jgi:hypothetical protein
VSELVDTLHDQQQRRIDDMLTHYDDARDCLYSGGMGSGEMGRGWLESPDVWRLSGYPILERLLVAMKTGAEDLYGPALYGQVSSFYFRAKRVRRPLMRSHKGKPQQAILNGVPQFHVVTERPGDRAKVREALGWLSSRWPERARYQPELVEEIVARLERRTSRVAA